MKLKFKQNAVALQHLNSMHTVGLTQLVGYSPDQNVQTNIVFF